MEHKRIRREIEIIKKLDEFYSKRDAPVKETHKLLSNARPFQILIFVLLSSRTKDEQTIKVCKKLFKKVKKPQDILKLKEEELKAMIYGVGFYKTKVKYLYSLSKILIERFNGQVPKDFKHLTMLPGVGRKTANLVLSLAHEKDSIAVDIHVHRISNRLGLVNTKSPEETEKDLKEIFPKKYWRKINYLFVAHGQTICKANKPKCEECPIKQHCNYYKKNG